MSVSNSEEATPQNEPRPSETPGAAGRSSLPRILTASPRRPGPRDPAAAYRRIAWLLIGLVLVPSGLLIGVGTLLLVRGTPDWNLVLGILVIVFCGLLATGTTLVWVFIAKEQGLSQLQTDFVSKVSHELKTPLTSIRLFVDTLKLKRATEPAQVDQLVDLLAQETERLTERINQLLEWGRMEAGRRVYDLVPADLGEVTRSAIEHFAPLQLQADVELSVEVESNLPKARIDRAALTEALLNFLSNAYKYGGRPRRIEVKVGAARERKRVFVSVHDNGQGIPPDEHKRIFQKFYRRDDRLSRAAEGSGLGLAIAAHVARGHRGRIYVQSDVGQGATFTLEIPMMVEEAA